MKIEGLDKGFLKKQKVTTSAKEQYGHTSGRTPYNWADISIQEQEEGKGSYCQAEPEACPEGVKAEIADKHGQQRQIDDTCATTMHSQSKGRCIHLSAPLLPSKFRERISRRLAGEAELLLNSLEGQRTYGLRVNTLKLPLEHVRQVLPFNLQGVPWCDSGFYYAADERPGLHPLHQAGLYYIQEPSAMYVAEALDVHPGHHVLDLCASPGGKSTQITAKLRGRGFLLANEVVPSRANTLVFNIERFGARNFVVTSASAEQLAQQLPAHFDRILIDAPCSGEGLFRKDPSTRLHWDEGHPAGCARRQRELIQWGAKMLKPEGLLVYSTCTFAEEENEWLIHSFLRDNPEFSAVVPALPGEHGLVITDPPAVKLLPHRLQGEGHFCAVLRKESTEPPARTPHWIPPAFPREAAQVWQSFARDHCPQLEHDQSLYMLGDSLFLASEGVPVLRGIRTPRMGLKLGRVSGKHLIPDHALALSLEELVTPRADYHPEDRHLRQYLRGETIPCTLGKGWTLVCCQGHPLGWGKSSDNMLKNHLPKGLRELR
jgi:NOL1/NOP2/sun family putative RNA methylase